MLALLHPSAQMENWADYRLAASQIQAVEADLYQGGYVSSLVLPILKDIKRALELKAFERKGALGVLMLVFSTPADDNYRKLLPSASSVLLFGVHSVVLHLGCTPYFSQDWPLFLPPGWPLAFDTVLMYKLGGKQLMLSIVLGVTHLECSFTWDQTPPQLLRIKMDDFALLHDGAYGLKRAEAFQGMVMTALAPERFEEHGAPRFLPHDRGFRRLSGFPLEITSPSGGRWDDEY